MRAKKSEGMSHLCTNSPYQAVVQCSVGRPTPAETRGKIETPQARGGSTSSPQESGRPQRNETPHLFSPPIKQKKGVMRRPPLCTPHIKAKVQCSVGRPTPAETRGKIETPQARGGSTSSPQESGRPQRNETPHLFSPPTKQKKGGIETCPSIH